MFHGRSEACLQKAASLNHCTVFGLIIHSEKL